MKKPLSHSNAAHVASLCTQKERKRQVPFALCSCQRSTEVICHPVVSTGVGCSDKLAWIKCQP